MTGAVARTGLLWVLLITTLSLRALTPAGYMPASPGSGLLFELCPDGMPAERVQALSGGTHDHHHGSDDASTSATDQCPIGHMLSSAFLVDVAWSFELIPEAPVFDDALFASVHRVRRVAYRSRAPPA